MTKTGASTESIWCNSNYSNPVTKTGSGALRGCPICCHLSLAPVFVTAPPNWGDLLLVSHYPPCPLSTLECALWLQRFWEPTIIVAHQMGNGIGRPSSSFCRNTFDHEIIYLLKRLNTLNIHLWKLISIFGNKFIKPCWKSYISELGKHQISKTLSVTSSTQAGTTILSRKLQSMIATNFLNIHSLRIFLG